MGTLAMVALLFSKQLIATSMPSRREWLLLLAASIVNGFGVYLYSKRAADSTVPTGAFVVMVAVSIAMAAPLLAFFVNREKLSLEQAIGLGCAVIAIYLLRR